LLRGCPVFKRAKKNIRPSKAPSAKVPESNHHSSPKSYVKATRIQDSSTDYISAILSNCITNLLSSVLKALILITSLSP